MPTAIGFSPAAAIGSPHWRTRFLPAGCDLRASGQGRHPLAGGRLGEPVAIGAVGDQDVRVVQQAVDGGGGQRLGHQFVEGIWSWLMFAVRHPCSCLG
jgi:hypothetical protein